MSFSQEEDEGFVVKVRGLPWSANAEEVANFLEDVNILDGTDGIHFTFVRDGRPSGEAYIELASQEDLEKAVAKDKHHMGKRYIEVFQSKRSEMEWVVKRSGPNQMANNSDAVIRLRGLPFGCSKEEIAHFFSGMEIVPNGITLMHDQQGRTTGDAYVQFATQEIAEKAQQKHKEKIGHRYIEIFKSSLAEARSAMSPMGRMRGPMGGMGGRPSPYDRMDRFGGGGMGMGGGGGGGMGGYGRGRARGNIKGGYMDDGYDDFSGGFGGYGRGGMGNRRGGMGGGMGMGMGGGMGKMNRFNAMGGNKGMGQAVSNHKSQTGHCVHMRGLPFAANEQDILDFFKPLNPVNVVIHFNNDGRASGEADVDFATHEEAEEALKKDRGTMQHRYIELFLKSTPSGKSSGGFGSGMGGGFGNNGSGFGDGNFDNNMGSGFGNDGSGFGSGGYGNGMSGMGSGFGMGNMGGNNMGNPNYTAF